MRVEVTSNFDRFMAEFRYANHRRPIRIREVLSKVGSDYVRAVVKNELSGKGGLKRVTGFGARSFYRQVIQRGDVTELVTFTTASYLRYHADDYTPAAEPRRHPVRLRAGEWWRWSTDERALIATLDAIMTRRDATWRPGAA